MSRTDRVLAARRPSSDDLPPTLVRGEMKYWLLRPDARLRDHVRCYFVVEATGRRAPKEELLLPDGYAELVFMLQGSFERAPIDLEAPKSAMQRSYLIAARSHSVLTQDLGRFRVVGVKLEPAFLHRMLRSPLGELRDATLPLADLGMPSLENLETEIGCSRGIAQMARNLDDFFVAQAQATQAGDALVRSFVRWVRDSRGASSVSQWARANEIDPRTLERKCSAWLGLTPKAYARIVRFKHSYHGLTTRTSAAPKSASAAAASYLDGYYDQSHFYKEFRSFTGASPSTLIARLRSRTEVTDHLLQGDLLDA